MLERSLELALALEHLHHHMPETFVVHRDLKPDNVGFKADGTLKLVSVDKQFQYVWVTALFKVLLHWLYVSPVVHCFKTLRFVSLFRMDDIYPAACNIRPVFDCFYQFDFGLARVVKRRNRVNARYEMTGETGSMRYMAPEVSSEMSRSFKGLSQQQQLIL